MNFKSSHKIPQVSRRLEKPSQKCRPLIKAHARVYKLFDEKYRTAGAKLGITLNSNYPYSYYPEDPTLQNFVIAERAFVTEWFTEPIFGGGDYSKAFKV